MEHAKAFAHRSCDLDRGPTAQRNRPGRKRQVKPLSHRRLHSGLLLLVKHGTRIDQGSDRRSHLTAYLSDDDGATWGTGFLLDERHQISYPDVALAPDGYLYVQYDRNRADDGEILFARITEEDIVAGTIVSERSALRKIVSRPRGKRS